MGIIKRIGLPLVIIFLILIIAFLVLDLQSSFEPAFLLPILNTLFIGLIPIIVAFYAAKTYHETDSISALFMGCGMLVLALGSILAGWLRYIPDGANVSVTIFNLSAMISAVFHLTAAMWGGKSEIIQAFFRKKKLVLILSILGICTYTILLVMATLMKIMPPFIDKNGFTILRQIVLVSAIVFYFSASMLLSKNYQEHRTDYTYLYFMSLLLFSVGLFGASLVPAVGNLSGWVGRTALYCSGFFAWFSMKSALKDAKVKNTSISNIMADFFADGETSYRGLVETSNDAIVSMDQEFRVLYLNTAAEKMFGVSKDQVEYLSFLDQHIPGLGKELLQNDFQAFVTSGKNDNMRKTIEIDARDSENRVFPTEISTSMRVLPTGCVITYIIRDISSRREAEVVIRNKETIIIEQNTQLKQQNEILRRQADLLNLSNEAILTWDLNGAIISWNMGAEQMYGYRSDEVVGCISQDLLKTVLPSDLDDIKSLLARDGAWSGEIEHTTKDGRKIIVESRIQVIANELGQQTVLETCRDITERKKAEEKIRESEARFRSVLESTRDVIYRLNVQTSRYEYISPSCEATLGYSPDELMAIDMETGLSMIHPEDLPAMRIMLACLEERGEAQHEYRLHTKNGEYRWLSNRMSHTRDNVDRTLHRNGTIRDITEQKKMEMELRQQKEQLEVIFANISDAICLADHKGEYIMMNQAARDMLYQPDQLKEAGELLKHTICTDMEGNILTKEEMPLRRALSGEIVRNFKSFIKRPDKDLIVETNTCPIFDDEGKLVMGIACLHDITEQVKSEKIYQTQQEQLLKSEKEKNEALINTIQMKDEFLSLISHEFRTPLTVINSAVQTMELICKNELSDKAKGFLNRIRQNSNRQLKLINNLLDITRINAGNIKINKTNIDIIRFTKLVTESIIIFAEQKRITLSFSSTLSKKIMGVDDEKYERVLLNLLSNAIKFTPEGKSITVKMSQKILKGKCVICIQVSDNGVGIPDDKKDIIFERFGQVDTSYTRQAEGTGIGLHLVKMFVVMMGGEITLESEVGEGSTFTILIPIEKAVDALSEHVKIGISDQRLIQAKAIEFSDIYF